MTFFDTFYKGFNFQLKIKISILTLVTNRSIHKLTSTIIVKYVHFSLLQTFSKKLYLCADV